MNYIYKIYLSVVGVLQLCSRVIMFLVFKGLGAILVVFTIGHSECVSSGFSIYYKQEK